MISPPPAAAPAASAAPAKVDVVAKTTAGLILFAHGARDPEWAEPFRDIATRVAAERKDLTIKLAFLEAQTPPLADAITDLVNAGHGVIHIAPLFMAQGGHLKRDVPQLLNEIRQQHPALRLELLSVIGDVEGLRSAIAGWLTDAIPQATGR